MTTPYDREDFLLVLARKANESVLMGGHDTIRQPGGHSIKITVLEVRGSIVRLGIEAPAEVAIIRDELVEPYTERDVIPIAVAEAGVAVGQHEAVAEDERADA